MSVTVSLFPLLNDISLHVYCVCYNIFINVGNVLYFFSSEVCFKTGLEFPNKCSFKVETAQDYFKTGKFDLRMTFVSFQKGLTSYLSSLYNAFQDVLNRCVFRCIDILLICFSLGKL